MNIRFTVITIMLFISTFKVYSQNTNFSLKLNFEEKFKDDSILISIPDGKNNFQSLFDISFKESKYVKIPIPEISILKLNNENKIFGNISNPTPLIIIKPNTEVSYFVSNIFFVEEGNQIINIYSNNNSLTVKSSNKSNLEFLELRKVLNNNFNFESIENYIKKNPNSFVAFWEIAFDYSKNGYNGTYKSLLNLFSKKVKESNSYQKLIDLIKIDEETKIGNYFPTINLKDITLSKDSFKENKLTLIDYWSTTCAPCIKRFPELVNLYRKFNKSGLNIINIADEKGAKRQDLAVKILNDNNIIWKNYFDEKNEILNKLNIYGYPYLILVNNKGEIIERSFGSDHKKIEKFILEYLK